MNTDKVKVYYLVVSMLIIIFGLGVLGYLRYVDGEYVNRPLVIKSDQQNMKLVKREYRAGETVEAYITFCKLRSVEATVEWNLIDSYLIPYPKKTTNVQKSCHDDLVFAIEKIPANTPTGKYHFEGTFRYQVNPINEVTYYLKTEDFQIVR